jgi:sulfatase maturation enzyme AslB (radical SAM superfamily)
MSTVADAFETLEPAIDPNNRITFLLDWELTMKCNLDCSYCPTGIQGNHDNSTKHPPKNECIKALEFMFDYVDLYMRTKPKGIRYVILNVYGGEALHHPNIVEILGQVKKLYKPYQRRTTVYQNFTKKATFFKYNYTQLYTTIHNCIQSTKLYNT